MTRNKVRLRETGCGLAPSSIQRTRSALRLIALAISVPHTLSAHRSFALRDRGIISLFLFGRGQRFPGEDLHHFWLIRLPGFSSFESPEGLLHDPILKGVEGDHTHSATPFEEGPSFLKHLLQILQFTVDPDTEGLKGSRGRVEFSRLEPLGNGLINDLT